MTLTAASKRFVLFRRGSGWLRKCLACATLSGGEWDEGRATGVNENQKADED